MPVKMTDRERARDIASRHEYLKLIRQPFEAVVDEILEFVRQARKINATAKGQALTGNVYDGTPLSALNLWADGMYGYLCSPNLDWFSLTLPYTSSFSRGSRNMRQWNDKRIDEIPEVSQYLDDCVTVMRAALLRSNFYAIMPQFFRDGGSVGTAVMDCEEELKSGKIFFTPMHFREFCIAESMTGLADTIYRRYPVTAKNLVERFGIEKMESVKQGFKQMYARSPYEEFYVVRAIQPRSDYDEKKIDAKNMPWASYWMLEGEPRMLLDESGYRHFPSIVWRYRKETDEIYGRSPAWDAYSEIMLGNQEARTNLIAGQKMAEPPMVAPDYLRGLINSNPRGWTWVESMNEVPQSLNERMNLPFAVEMRERTDKAIEKHFHVDFFLMLSQAAANQIELTATQVIQMAGEKAAVLATRTDTLNIEAMNQIIDRVWDIETAAGRMPMPPDVLMEFEGANIEVDYLGPLAQAQKTMFQTQGIRASLADISQIAALNPEALDVFNSTEAVRQILKANRVPARVINSQDQIDAMREMRNKQAQMQQALESGTQIAGALPAAGKEVSENSPLGALMGAAGGMQ